MRVAPRAMAHDPGSASLRRGLRAAVVLPLAVVAAKLLNLKQPVTMFLVFGVIALLVFADFDVEAHSRQNAYLIAGTTGVPLIIIRTLASEMSGAQSQHPPWWDSCCGVRASSAATS